jgi:hypothetical protein
MPEISIDSFNLTQRVIVFLAMLAALAVLDLWSLTGLGCGSSYLTRSRVPDPSTGDRNTIAASTLFGIAAPERQATVVPPTGIEIKLLGLVVASRDWRGYAVLRFVQTRLSQRWKETTSSHAIRSYKFSRSMSS